MESKEQNKMTINGVDVVEDGDVIHFTVSDDALKEDERKRQEELKKKEEEPSSVIGKIGKWFKESRVKPYVKLRDLANPFGDRDDMDAGSDGKVGVEAGIKISF